MAIGWLTILKTVPWTDVVRNAPQIAEGARKLWVAIGTKPTAPKIEVEANQVTLSSETHTIDALQERLTAVESAWSDLHGQMLASSELIKELAEQNAQLIKKIELNRVRTLWLAGATICIAAIATFNLILTFLH
ncbi:hypothetical protein [Methylotenera versatilis]|uniref:hypothetical protein n=1 Tax=Methylotenera versatilis TaxID=1055487 RepID=UPI0006478DA8|nr:hypothetical protein [Methylotenera versatilis]